jgi:5-oxoprolinase (ATP-hydrolysing)
METPGWQFWIDRGGTFTDIVARAPDGAIGTMKLLSENPTRYEDAAAEGIGRMLAGLPPASRRVEAVRMGTTVATNALLERKGEPTVLVTTAGLRDVLRIGTQHRPQIFALDIRLPEMLYVGVIEARERLGAHGEVIVPLDERKLEAELAAQRNAGINSIAIALLHAYRFPAHERRAAEIARALGFEQVSVSHEVSPLMKLVPRGDTTLADAYLSPILDRYIDRLRRGLGDTLGNAPLLFMQSHGGLAAAEGFRGKDSLLSGPAGGVVGMATTATAAGFARVIGFDMGGTSTDVALFEGEYERTGNAVIAGVRVSAPMMRIHTVAAGGGSILKYASGRLQVGPESAGAHPGPACYRNGGPLTVTDANVLLGRIQPDFFPPVFGPDADQPLDAPAAAAAFAVLAAEVSADTSSHRSAEQIAAGFLKIAVERMANAIKTVSVQRGHDVAQFALSSFGGAGGQHACMVADALGIDKVLIHPLAGVLSAYGMGIADLRCVRQAAVERPLDRASLALIENELIGLESSAVAELGAQRVPARRTRVERRLRVKQRGSDTTLAVTLTPGMDADAITDAFGTAHAGHFGFVAESAPLIVESAEVEAIGEMEKPREHASAVREHRPAPIAVREIWFGEARLATPLHRRDSLAPGAVIDGPAVIVEDNATTVVEPAWRATVSGTHNLLLERAQPAARREAASAQCDPMLLEVFNSLFMHIAEQMGVVLESTAHSVNIKERLDFSCAVFDSAGELIANAPHMPVHLGSMGDSVQSILDANRGRMRPGDVYMMNAPYQGGTHLPDITVVTPVFEGDGASLRFVLACRAHHADIGGITPGSMPATSRSIDDEGVSFDNVLIVRDGVFREAEVRALLANHAYPARNPDQNIADLKAQIAANARGIVELERMVERFGPEVVAAYMRHIKYNAEQCIRRAIASLSDGSFVVELDGGERIAVAIRVDRDRGSALIDFTGTSPATSGNFNAPAAIARAAVLYVFRTLIREDIPLNAGCLTPLEIVLPAGSLVHPNPPAAVVAGNVETSQCITDALLGALEACAASQGTMNNLTFGNERHQYYETLCGGAGAGPGFNGASAVHTHMTNSRLTDAEVLEWRYPVRVARFELRRGSGGAGRWRGGDGVIRAIEFLEPMSAALLTNRRRVPPFGLAGGEPGLPGINRVERRDGTVETLGPTAELSLAPGDRLVIETPGGGGFGAGQEPG